MHQYELAERIIAVSDLAAYIVSFDGTIEHWSEKAQQLYGFRKSEIIGRPEQLLIPPTHHSSFDGFRELLRLRPNVKIDTVRRTASGKMLQVHLAACVLEKAKPTSILVFSTPLERGVQTSAMEAKLASIIQFSSDAIMSVTAEGIIDSWNAAAESLLGYSAQEIIGRPSSVLFPADRGWAKGMGASELAKGNRLMHDTVRRHKSGRELAVSLVASPLFSATGVYLGYTVILRDADQRTQAVAALRDAEQFNQRILEASKDWISAIDPQGRIMFTNEAGLAEITKSGFGGRHPRWLDMWPSALDAKFFAQALGGKEVEFVSVRSHVSGSPSHWRVSLAPIIDESGQLLRVVAVARDITADHRHRAHLDLMNKELSHRVKNVLAVISAMARNSTQGEPLEQFQDRLTARIRALAKSHDLLVATDWTGLDLRDLATSQLGGLLSGGNRIKLFGCSLKLKTQAAQMLGMALHELATNAVKYGPLGDAGGQVQLDWTLTDSEKGLSSLAIDWIEHTAKPVPTHRRPGFGSQILEDAVADTTNGQATFEITSRGARWSLRVPDVSSIIAA
jgi:PAS domain S-box-containing protein